MRRWRLLTLALGGGGGKRHPVALQPTRLTRVEFLARPLQHLLRGREGKGPALIANHLRHAPGDGAKLGAGVERGHGVPGSVREFGSVEIDDGEGHFSTLSTGRFVGFSQPARQFYSTPRPAATVFARIRRA